MTSISYIAIKKLWICVFNVFTEGAVSGAERRVDRKGDPVCVMPTQRSVEGANDCVTAEVSVCFFATEKKLIMEVDITTI